MMATIRNSVIERSRTARAERLKRLMSVARQARGGDPHVLAFVQEMPAEGDDGVARADAAGNDRLFAVEAHEGDRPVRARRGLAVEQPPPRPLALVVDGTEWDRQAGGRLRAVQVDGDGGAERRPGGGAFQHVARLEGAGQRV